MASYTRQSSFADGDTITAALFNNEFNQLVNAFHNSTGHKHDGTTAEGPVIGLIGDAGETSPNNKVLIDTTNNYIEFYVEVSSAPVQQLYIADGAIIPVTDSDVDLGTTSLRFKDTYTDTVTTTGNVDIGGNLTVTGNATISGNLTFGDADTDSINLAAEIDSDIIPNTDGTYDLGSATKEWQDLYIDGTANIDSLVADTADINGGTIDGATIATSDITVGAGKTLDVSSGTITLADDQISGDKVEGGTIAATTITSLTATSADINGGTIDGTTIATSDITVGASKTLDVSAGTLTLADNQISGDKVEGGTIAATTITDLTFGSLNDGTITATAFVDEDDMTSDSATLIPTQQSVKAYVDSQVTAQDLDFQGDSGGALSIDLDSETLTIAGGTGLDTVGSGNTVTVNIDSTVATLTGSQTLTNKTLTSPVINTGVSGTAVLDEDDMSSDSATQLATQQSIKAYVDSQVTAQDLDLTTDSGTIAIDLDSETLTIGGTSNEIETSATGNAVTIGIPAAAEITTSLGIGGGSTNGVVISQGAISIKNGGTQSYIDFYCESANAHYARLQAPAHGSFSGNPTLTLPATAGTLVGSGDSGTVTNTMLAGSIANAKLSSSTVSFGGVSLELGGSDATPAFDLTDATNYPTSSLTGTITNAQLAGSIANAKLANSSITVSGGTSTTAIALGGTITFAGTSNEVDVSESSGTITYGLPSDVTITNDLTVSNDLVVSGNLTVTGTTTQTGPIVSDDNFTGLTNGNTGNATDFGLYGKYVESSTTKYAGLFYDASTDNTFRLFADTQTEPATTVNTGATGYAAADLIIAGLTASSGTISGDLTVDTNTLKVDSTNNRVGILNASPDVSLDVGSATDAIHVPSGTTAQRPTGANGYFRYNSEDAQFEGYADGAWGAIAGSGGGASGSAVDQNTFTGDGSTTAFTLAEAPTGEDNTIVFIDGVYQDDSTYSVSGTTLTFSTAPSNTRVITVYTITTGILGTAPSIDTMTGDNSDTTLTLSVAPVSENATFVTIDGVVQHKDTYSVSGTTLTFSVAPPTGTAVECITFANTTVTTTKLIQDADNDTLIQVEESSDEDKIRFDTAGSERMVIDNSGNVGINTSSPSQLLHLGGATNKGIQITSSTSNAGYLAVYQDQTLFGSNRDPADGSFADAGKTAQFISLQSGNGLGWIRFSTTATNNIEPPERMRIDGAGHVLINTTTLQGAGGLSLQVGGNGVGLENNTTSSAGNGHEYQVFRRNSSQIGSITMNGTTAVQYNTSSDYRLKENVVTEWDATTRLKQLRPSRFNFIGESDRTVDGFLAHEVQDIVPEAIAGVKDEMQEEEYEVTPAVLDENGNVVTEAVMGTREVPKYQGIDQSKLVPLLVKTIQELEERITTLENA